MTLTFTCDLEFAILHVVFGSVTVTEKLLRDKFYQISCTETHWHEQFKWIIILWLWPWTLYLNTCIGKSSRLRKQSAFIKWHNIQIWYAIVPYVSFSQICRKKRELKSPHSHRSHWSRKMTPVLKAWTRASCPNSVHSGAVPQQPHL